MTTQSNNKTILFGCMGFGAFIIISLLIVGGMFMSANNNAVNAEAGIEASYKESENVLGQYAPKLTEALGVTGLQADAVANIIKEANSSRYGSDGSQATVQWIKEQNPNLDQSNYGKVITMIEAGRDDFSSKQMMTIDRVRQYKVMVSSFPGKIFYSVLGYPTSGFMEKYSKIVVSSHANKAFDTGIDDGVDIKKTK